jgi:hypothetical protein
VSSLRDSICVKFYPALPCRATDCPVPPGLISSGNLRFFAISFKAVLVGLVKLRAETHAHQKREFSRMGYKAHTLHESRP